MVNKTFWERFSSNLIQIGRISSKLTLSWITDSHLVGYPQPNFLFGAFVGLSTYYCFTSSLSTLLGFGAAYYAFKWTVTAFSPSKPWRHQLCVLQHWIPIHSLLRESLQRIKASDPFFREHTVRSGSLELRSYSLTTTNQSNQAKRDIEIEFDLVTFE